MNEYQDQSVWFEVYGLGSGTEWFVEDFDTRWEAEAFAEGYFGQYEEYRIKRCTGLDER